jgi:hypothetical protein
MKKDQRVTGAVLVVPGPNAAQIDVARHLVDSSSNEFVPPLAGIGGRR